MNRSYTIQSVKMEKHTCAYVSKKTGEKCTVCPRGGAEFCSKHAKSKNKDSPAKNTPKKDTPKKDTPKKDTPQTQIDILDDTVPELPPPKAKKEKVVKSSKKKESGRQLKNVEQITQESKINVIKDIEDGKFYNIETGFVFILSETSENKNFDPIVIGHRDDRNAPLKTLDLENIELCRCNHWKFQIPHMIETENKRQEEDIDDKYDAEMAKKEPKKESPKDSQKEVQNDEMTEEEEEED